MELKCVIRRPQVLAPHSRGPNVPSVDIMQSHIQNFIPAAKSEILNFLSRKLSIN